MATLTLHERAEQLFVTCKRCEGEGRLWADGKAHYALEPVATIDCPLCGGTGQMGPDSAAIESALRDVVEECAKVADNEMTAWRDSDSDDVYGAKCASKEIAAAIRRLKEERG